ncbi:MAG: 30S ribosomal protein S4 [Acidimicrobiia bacterium]|nr:30S ribosomal protein S4 [Acidimicrobiia bacterium]MDH4308626.1 30S ribosomal protein S4 [Acidimicrobiia bacterium]MDH5293962.1 30S ribosomal protein S4 [Acidimicrobiia bacterium]
MARNTGPRHKACRRARQPLCQSKKCPVDRRPYPPGQHGRGRIRESDYLVQLREKQKLRMMYGVLEKQFRRYYQLASRQPGITGENLLRLLETRLDNVVWRSGLAETRPQARQLVNHGHFRVNGKKVDIASYRVRKGDVVTIKEKSKDLIMIQHSVDTLGRPIPDWLSVTHAERKVVVLDVPSRHQIDTSINEQLIVELYSK